MANWPNHFFSGKQFQKGQMATLDYLKNERRVRMIKNYIKSGEMKGQLILI